MWMHPCHGVVVCWAMTWLHSKKKALLTMVFTWNQEKSHNPDSKKIVDKILAIVRKLKNSFQFVWEIFNRYCLKILARDQQVCHVTNRRSLYNMFYKLDVERLCQMLQCYLCKLINICFDHVCRVKLSWSVCRTFR